MPYRGGLFRTLANAWHLRAARRRGFRRDDVVQVASHNLWWGRVAAVLREVEGVADVTVRLHASGRLKTFTVSHGARDLIELTATIDRAVRDRLSVAERPRSWRFGSALPHNATSKLEDWD